MKIEHVLFPSVFFKIADPCVGRSFSMCSHDSIFRTNINRILKNGSCERAFKFFYLQQLDPSYLDVVAKFDHPVRLGQGS